MAPASGGGPGGSPAGGAIADLDAQRGVDGATIGGSPDSLGSVKTRGDQRSAEDGRKVLGVRTQSVSYVIRDGRVANVTAMLSGDDCTALEHALRAKLGTPNGPMTGKGGILEWRGSAISVSYNAIAFTCNLQVYAPKF